MAGPFFAEGLLEAFTDDHELGGGLCGLAGFGDDIEEGFLGIAHLQDRIEVDGVYIVDDEDSGAVAVFGRLEVVSRRVECGLEGDVSECGAADAEDDEAFVFLGFFGDGLDCAHMLGSHGFLPEVVPAFPVGASGFGEGLGEGLDAFGGGGSWGDSGLVEAVRTDAGGEHVGVVDGDHVDSVCQLWALRGGLCDTIRRW